MTARHTNVIETWKVIDAWWTEHPTVTWWREIERDGKTVVQRHRRGERWTDVASASKVKP